MRSAALLLLSFLCALAQQPDAGDLLRRAVAAHQRHDFARAIADYRLVLDKHPELTSVRVNLAAALVDTGKLDDAIAVLGAVPGPDRASAPVLQGLALAYYRKDDLAAAARELEKLHAAQAGDLRVTSMLADCYLRTGAPGKALALVEPAAAAHPDNAELSYQLGTALLRSGRPNDALMPLERAATADGYLLAGATALDLGQFQRARGDLEKAVRMNPEIPGAWSWAGMARDRVSDEEGAKQAFRKALELDPRDFEANLHLGAILYRERELQAASPFLQRALEIRPSSDLAQYAMALVQSASGDVNGAVAGLESVTKTSPDWLEPHVKLASLYFRLHRQADGHREQEIVEKLKSRNPGRQSPLPELDGR